MVDESGMREAASACVTRGVKSCVNSRVSSRGVKSWACRVVGGRGSGTVMSFAFGSAEETGGAARGDWARHFAAAETALSPRRAMSPSLFMCNYMSPS